MSDIPRPIFGLHLALIGIATLVWLGEQAGWYGREPVIAAIAVAAASLFLVRPRFTLTAGGLRFTARVLWVLRVSYGAIDRTRIRSVKVTWEREDVVSESGVVVYSYRCPFLGIFLEYVWKEPSRTTTMCLARPEDFAHGKERAKEYARVLDCPLKTK